MGTDSAQIAIIASILVTIGLVIVAWILKILRPNDIVASNEDSSPASAPEIQASAPADEVANFDIILKNCAGEISCVGEILETFKTETANNLMEIERAVFAHDPNGVQRAARRLRMSAANVAAEPLGNVAFRIEESGRKATMSGIDAAMIEARREVRRCIEMIQSKLPFKPSTRA